MSERTTAAIPKGRVIITYCNGIGCNASVKGAARMITLGFRVKEMMGGLDWWKRNGQPVETAQDAPTCSASRAPWDPWSLRLLIEAIDACPMDHNTPARLMSCA
jgi:3-mercaptopyruvate sulfurtransferase SseA